MRIRLITKGTLIKIITLLIPLLFSTIFNFYSFNNKNINAKIIESDVINYYAFLPGLIIENDLTFKFIEEDPGKYSSRYWMFKLENGNYVSKVTIGMSLMYLPFFLLSHAYSLLTGHEADGFSMPYRIGILFAALFYVIMAMLLLRALLRNSFNEIVTTLVLTLLFFATNVFYYTTGEAGMSHVYSFFVISLFAFLSDRFYKQPSFKKTIALGLVFGLIILIRPTNGIAGVILPLWAITNYSSIVYRLRFWFVENKYFVVGFVLGFTLMILPQVAYWKIITGNLVFNGYEDGSYFHFTNPQIINSLFSFRKGWFLYTPLMLLVIPGLYVLFSKHRVYFWPVLSIFVLSVYLNSSWWLWWFGGGYGNRSYIDFYGIFALALAAFIQLMYSKTKLFGKITMGVIVLVFIFHNLFQVVQYANGAIHMSGMTKEAYFFSMGRLYPKLPLRYLISEPDKTLAAKGIYPRPVIPSRSSEDWIQIYEKSIRENPEMMKIIEEKSLKWGVPVDTTLRNDARWSYKKDFRLK